MFIRKNKPKPLLWMDTFCPFFLKIFLLLRNPSAVIIKNAIIKTNNVEYLILVAYDVVAKIKFSGKSAATFYLK